MGKHAKLKQTITWLKGQRLTGRHPDVPEIIRYVANTWSGTPPKQVEFIANGAVAHIGQELIYR